MVCFHLLSHKWSWGLLSCHRDSEIRVAFVCVLLCSFVRWASFAPNCANCICKRSWKMLAFVFSTVSKWRDTQTFFLFLLTFMVNWLNPLWKLLLLWKFHCRIDGGFCFRFLPKSLSQPRFLVLLDFLIPTLKKLCHNALNSTVKTHLLLEVLKSSGKRLQAETSVVFCFRVFHDSWGV